MRALWDLLSEGFEPSPADVGRIVARTAGLLRYGHDHGAVHGDLTPKTILVEQQGDDWAVELAQPRPAANARSTAADDVLGLGRVLDLLVRDIPQHRLPALFPAALASMTDADAARRPQAAQVEQYFARDYRDGLPADPGSSATTALPVGAAPPRDDTGDWRPSQHGTAYPDDEEQGLTASRGVVGAPRRRGPVAVVSLVVLLLLGGLSVVLWGALGASEQQAPVAGTGTTDGQRVEEEVGSDPEAGRGSSAIEDPDEVEEATQEAAAPASPARTEASAPSSPTESPTSETQVAAPSDDYATPDWEGHGWDVEVLDRAYCRDGSRFIGLADTETYRGVICGHASGYSYRGLNKAGNATLHSTAEPFGTGWLGLGQGGVRYEFDENMFAIYDSDHTLIDEEEVTTWLTPEHTPFRPGDLDLTQPISYPACDGSAVVVLSSWAAGGDVARLVQQALDEHPGSFYIRTDLSCDNFNRPDPELSGMEYIYAVLRPVGSDTDTVCAVIEETDRYGYWLQEGVDPGIHINCD